MTLQACSSASSPAASTAGTSPSATVPAVSTPSIAPPSESGSSSPNTTSASPTQTSATSEEMTPSSSAAPMTEVIDFPNQLENIAGVQFSDSTTVDNTYFPLKPGMQYTYSGTADQDGVPTPHTFILTVSDMVKTVNGVRNVVVWDQDLSDGVLHEAELAFFAQADDGNLWHFGQYPEVYEDGEIVATATWIAGIDGAAPGINIKATPNLGGPSYSQGWSPTVPWTDRARVGQVGLETCVPTGCYKNVIVTEEFSREEPNALQLKFYAPKVGNIRVDFSGADQTKETLELASAVELDAAGLAKVRQAVLDLEKSGFEQSPDVYGKTEPMHPLG